MPKLTGAGTPSTWRTCRGVALGIAGSLTIGCTVVVPPDNSPLPLPITPENVITVRSIPTGASVTVKKPSGEVLGAGATPFKIHVHCDDTAVVTVSAPGFASQTVTDPAGYASHPFVVGSLILGNPIQCHKQPEVDVTLERAAARPQGAQ